MWLCLSLSCYSHHIAQSDTGFNCIYDEFGVTSWRQFPIVSTYCVFVIQLSPGHQLSRLTRLPRWQVINNLCHRLLLFFTRYVLTSLRWNSLERRKKTTTQNWFQFKVQPHKIKQAIISKLLTILNLCSASVCVKLCSGYIRPCCKETWLDVNILYCWMKDICFQWFPFLFAVTLEYCCRKWPLTDSTLFF